MLIPFRCQPMYQKKVWGGRWFEKVLGRQLPDLDNYGESWELTCRADAMSIVLDGPFQGRTLYDLMMEKSIELLGERIVLKGFDPFPLLVKLIDSADHLSIQVHPDDRYAQERMLNDMGKTEMWYIIEADPGASLILGLKEGVTQRELEDCMLTGQILLCMNQFQVNAGDAFFIPAGTVHAILKGVRLVEIQQNSDLTFRLYDWGRLGLDGKPRKLHVEDALQAIHYNQGVIKSHPGIVSSTPGCFRKLLVTCPYFAVEELSIQKLQNRLNGESFEVWMVLEGEADLQLKGNCMHLRQGETWMIPASIGTFTLNGLIKILKIYIPVS